MSYRDAQEVLDTLVQAYYEDRNEEIVLSCVTDDVEWIDADDCGSASGKTALRQLLEKDLAHHQDDFGVTMQQSTVKQIGRDAVLFTLVGKQKRISEMQADMAVRATVCCINTDKGWLACSVHASVPNKDRALRDQLQMDMTRFQLVADEMNAAIFEWDFLKNAFYHSAAYQHYAISQIDPADILHNKAPLDVIHKDDVGILRKFFDESNAGKDRAECTLRLKLISGDYHWCRMLGLFYRDEQGVPTHTIGIIIDVNNEHENSIKMSNLMNAIPCGIGTFVFADTLRCHFYSDGFSKMAGLTRAEMDQKLADHTVLSSLIAPVDYPQVAPMLAEKTAKGLPLNMTYRYLYKDESIRWLHLTAEKMGEEDGYPVYHCVFTNPTEEIALYRNLTEDSVNGVAVFERESSNVLYINSAAVQYYGLTTIAQTVGAPFAEVLRTHQLQVFLSDADIASLKEDQYSTFHVERREHYYAVRGKRLLWNHMDAYILYITDETAEHQKEKQLENLLNQIPCGISIYHVDENGVNQTFVNQGFYRSFGISQEQYAQYSGYQTVYAAYEDDRVIIQKEVEKIRNGADECSFVYRSSLPGRDTIWMRLLGTVVQRQGMNFTLYAAFMDVTQQILTQNRQKELFDTIPSGILEFCFDGMYVSVLSANQTLMDMIGYSEQEFASKAYWKLSDVVHPEDYHLLVEARKSVRLGKGKSYDFRLFNQKTGLYRWISCDYTITEHTDTGIKVISAFLDVDDKRKAEDANAAKSRFLSRMSHEIRTPINAIMGIAELEKQDIENRTLNLDNIEKYAQETLTASGYLLTLVNDILDTSRIENNQVEIQQHPVRAEQYLADVRTLIEPMAKEKNIQFILERKTKTREVYVGDGIRVKQILVNLLSNAFKFTPPGGTVKLSCEAVNETDEHTTLQFTVTDNGIGMSKEFLQNLFIPFAQENSKNTSPFAGTGLGLSIAKNLAVKMGGDIVCKSEKGKGTTFIATIVVGNASEGLIDEAQDDSDQTAVKNLHLDGTRILVCEDHPLNQKITRALLERKKCIVEIAADGVIGVDLFEKSAVGYYAMILMDIRMPNMDGLQATQEIRSLNRPDAKTIPIVAMSANAYDEDVQKSLAAGMNDHLAKPVDAAKLYRAIAHYTQKKDSVEEKPLVLVVDDIEINRVVIGKTLRTTYRVLEAENGKQALKVLEDNPEIIAVVTDIQMPEMDGISLIKNIRSEYRYEDLAILVSTQYGDAKQEKELLMIGADDFTYKPTSPTLLAIRLKNVLARRKHIL